MVLDINSLLGTNRAIGVARADYDFTRDGGALYAHDVPTETIPDGSIIVGFMIHTTRAITTSLAGVLSFVVNGLVLGPAAPTLDYVYQLFLTGVASPPTVGARSIEAYVSVGALTDGAATIYVYYLPVA